MGDTKHDRETVIDAIKGEGVFAKSGVDMSSFGNVSNVATRLKVTRATVYSYMERWKTVEDAMMDERNSFLDLCENKLASEVNKGNITAIIFALKTIGKSRGYIERAEVINDGKMEIIVKYADRKRNDTDTP
jgi:hypothetical protein